MSAGDITVAVAVCGRADGLARCLAQLLDGTSLPGALIVVDQEPSQEAREIVERVTAIPARDVEQPRLGLSASRNLALELTTTRVIAVTDDDCVPDVDWVRAIGAALSREPAPAAVTGSVKALGPQPPGTYAVSLRERPDAHDFAGRIIPWTVGTGANFAAPCALLRARGGWDERLGTGSPGRAAEDSDLIYRIMREGGVVRYDPAMIIRHEWQTRRTANVDAMVVRVRHRRDVRSLAPAPRLVRVANDRGVRTYSRGSDAPRHRGPRYHAMAQRWKALTSMPAGLVHGLRRHPR